ncbi:MAG TPA: hypothetical protein VNN80_19775 [Polyangiaceae bacterium]|nr:hypothetical protein [Polyangiaceae bacterium]
MACNTSGPTPSSASVEETGKDLSKNPLGALANLASAGKELAAKAEELQKRAPVDPVKFDALIALLPEPAGWKAAEAKGQTTTMASWKISNANRRYTKGEGKDAERVKVDLVDGGYVPMVYASFTVMSKVSQESTEGYTKGITVEGYPAVERWTKKSKRVELTILIADRFLLTISGDDTTPESVREWPGLIGLSKIAALNKA